MSDYRCNGCGGYGISCSCYRHSPGLEERAADDAAREVRRELERLFKDYINGYSYRYDERVPVTELDEGMLNRAGELKAEYTRLKKKRDELSKTMREIGEEKHNQRMENRRLDELERAQKAEARERVIERLVEEEFEARDG